MNDDDMQNLPGLHGCDDGDDSDDDDDIDWEQVEWILTEVSLEEAETLPAFGPAIIYANCLPEDWTILYWALRLDTLPFSSCTFAPVGGLPSGSGFGTYIRVPLARPDHSSKADDPTSFDVLEALLDDKTLRVTVVAPKWYWEHYSSAASPLPGSG